MKKNLFADVAAALAAGWLALALAGALSLTLAAPLAHAHAVRGATPCPPDAIRVELLPFEVREDFTRSYAELADNDAGLVRQTLTVKVDGCSVTVGYAQPVLYVARELLRDPCAFDTVLAHERQHVAIYRRALADLAPRILAAAATQPLFEAALRETAAVRPLHVAFDRVEDNARRNAHACGGRILHLLIPLHAAGGWLTAR